MPQKTVTLSLETYLDIDAIPKGMRSRVLDLAVRDFLIKWEYDTKCIRSICRGRPEEAFKRREAIRAGEIEFDDILSERIG